MFSASMQSGDSESLPFTSPAKYSAPIALLFALPVCVLLSLGIAMIVGKNNDRSGEVAFGLLGFVLLLFFALAPRRFEIHADHVAIVIGCAHLHWEP